MNVYLILIDPSYCTIGYCVSSDTLLRHIAHRDSRMLKIKTGYNKRVKRNGLATLDPLEARPDSRVKRDQGTFKLRCNFF